MYLVRYLLKTHYLGIKFAPNQTKGFKGYVDADFCKNGGKLFASSDPTTAKSRSSWIIFYADCPVHWASKLQTQVVLSITEAEYIAILSSLRDVIPIMDLVAEIMNHNFQVIC